LVTRGRGLSSLNGILGDKTPQGGNVLTADILHRLPPHDGEKVIFGEGCRLGSARLKRERIVYSGKSPTRFG